MLFLCLYLLVLLLINVTRGTLIIIFFLLIYILYIVGNIFLSQILLKLFSGLIVSQNLLRSGIIVQINVVRFHFVVNNTENDGHYKGEGQADPFLMNNWFIAFPFGNDIY